MSASNFGKDSNDMASFCAAAAASVLLLAHWSGVGIN
jgi:hypothetical protein